MDRAQFEALKAYKEKLATDSLYFSYESPEQFRQLLTGHLAGTLHAIHANAPLPENSATDGQAALLRKFRGRFESFVRRLESEWTSERDSEPHGTETGKFVLARALDSVHEFRSAIEDGLEEVVTLLDGAAKELRSIERHQLYMDGGKSFREFWELGDTIIAKLKSAAEKLTEEEKKTGA